MTPITDTFYIEKFMEIQQQNVVMYKLLLKINESPKLKEQVELELGVNISDVIKNCPA